MRGSADLDRQMMAAMQKYRDRIDVLSAVREIVRNVYDENVQGEKFNKIIESIIDSKLSVDSCRIDGDSDEVAAMRYLLIATMLRAPVNSWATGVDHNVRNASRGDLMRDARRLFHIDQKSLADAIGCTREYISRLESGVASPNDMGLNLSYRICAMLNIPLDVFARSFLE